MPTPPRVPQGEQLLLLFPAPEAPVLDLDVQAGHLVALNGAARLVVGIAEGRVQQSPEVVERLIRSLSVLAAHDAGGRLGHVVRRYLERPVAGPRWAELVDELAFVLSLVHPAPTPTPGGSR